MINNPVSKPASKLLFTRLDINNDQTVNNYLINNLFINIHIAFIS